MARCNWIEHHAIRPPTGGLLHRNVRCPEQGTQRFVWTGGGTPAAGRNPLFCEEHARRTYTRGVTPWQPEQLEEAR